MTSNYKLYLYSEAINGKQLYLFFYQRQFWSGLLKTSDKWWREKKAFYSKHLLQQAADEHKTGTTICCAGYINTDCLYTHLNHNGEKHHPDRTLGWHPLPQFFKPIAHNSVLAYFKSNKNIILASRFKIRICLTYYALLCLLMVL